MKKRQRAKRRARKSARKIDQKFLDEFATRHDRILEGEEWRREARAKLKEMGRPDLARKFLHAPMMLKDFAGFVWREEPLVAVSAPTANVRAPSAADFPEKQFLLTRDVHGGPITVKRSGGTTDYGDGNRMLRVS
jgi:hypothetical protein